MELTITFKKEPEPPLFSIVNIPCSSALPPLYPSQSKIEIDYSMNNQHRIIDAGKGAASLGGRGININEFVRRLIVYTLVCA
jgi:hypothetical protein